MDDFIVTKDEDNFTFFGSADEDEEPAYIGDDVHKATKSFQVYFFPEIAAVTVSPVMAVMVTSPVAKVFTGGAPVKELSPVRHFHR